jgi:hypothetical protein
MGNGTSLGDTKIPENKTASKIVYRHFLEILKILENQCYQTVEVLNAQMMIESIAYHTVKTVQNDFALEPTEKINTANNLEA